MKRRNKFLPTVSSKCHTIHAKYAFQLEDLFQCFISSSSINLFKDKLLKVTGNATNKYKHINEASKQTFANNLI